jgi:DNA polymerase-3 subunit epsilon
MSELKSLIEMMDSRRDWLVLDTETTDLNGEFVELALWDNATGQMHTWLSQPVGAISHEAQRVHGIGSEMLVNAPQAPHIVNEVYRIISGRPLVIYNSGFDTRIIHNSLRKRGVSEFVPIHEIASSIHCAMLGYAEHWGDWNDYHGNYRWVKLGDALRQQRLELPSQYRLHRADADVYATTMLIDHLYTKLS